MSATAAAMLASLRTVAPPPAAASAASSAASSAAAQASAEASANGVASRRPDLPDLNIQREPIPSSVSEVADLSSGVHFTGVVDYTTTMWYKLAQKAHVTNQDWKPKILTARPPDNDHGIGLGERETGEAIERTMAGCTVRYVDANVVSAIQAVVEWIDSNDKAVFDEAHEKERIESLWKVPRIRNLFGVAVGMAMSDVNINGPKRVASAGKKRSIRQGYINAMKQLSVALTEKSKQGWRKTVFSASSRARTSHAPPF